MKKIGLGLLVIGLIGFSFHHFTSNRIVEELNVEPAEHPGWYKFQEEKKGYNNPDVPKNLYASWFKSDQQSKLFFKKSTQSLENIKELGPTNVGGRIRAVVVDHSNPNRYIVGGVSGGIWVSENQGTTWTNVNDTAPTLSVTAITQDPFNKDVFYYGTGETIGNSADLGSLGIFKSTDGGNTFQHLAYTVDLAIGNIWDIKHSKVLPNTLYVSTAGSGIWRSTDAGASFTRIFNSSQDIFEMECFEDSTVLYSRESTGIFRFNENSLKSTHLNNGWPSSGYRRITFDAADSFPNVIYAHLNNLTQDELAYSVKSSDGGKSWTSTNLPTNVGRYTYSWYCFDLTVAPTDTNFVMSNSVESVYSRNGGNNWVEAGETHVDYHSSAWINDNTVLIGNDGGLYRMAKATMNNATDLNFGLNITQFYTGYYPPEGSNEIFGGTQDNGTRYSPAGQSIFARYYGGDGSFCAIGQGDEDVKYFSWQELNLYRSIDGEGEVKISNPLRNALDGNNGTYFIHPFEINKKDASQIYVPSIRGFYRSTNYGTSWVDMTGDLIGDQYAVGLTNEENPTAYIGGNASRLYRIDNVATAAAGQQVDLWSTTYPLFLGGLINCIEVDPNDKTVIYCAMNNVSTRARIWKVTSADTDNPVMIDISGNLPEALPVNWVEVDPTDSRSIFIGTDYGLYSSLNGGESWQKEYRIPNVPIDQIRLRDSDRKLFIYTHGRGIWSADLIDEAIASTSNLKSKKVTLYPNPSSDFIQIKGVQNLNEVKVYAMNGQQVLTSTSSRTDISNLPSGNYFVEIIGDGSTVVEKLLVE